MIDYEGKSDLEINKAIANLLRVYWFLSPDRGDSNQWEYCDYYGQIDREVGEHEESLPDYCNNPADMWPIIVEHKINLEYYDYPNQNWLASAAFSLQEFSGKSPLRAAAIVFLMMKHK